MVLQSFIYVHKQKQSKRNKYSQTDLNKIGISTRFGWLQAKSSLRCFTKNSMTDISFSNKMPLQFQEYYICRFWHHDWCTQNFFWQHSCATSVWKLKLIAKKRKMFLLVRKTTTIAADKWMDCGQCGIWEIFCFILLSKLQDFFSSHILSGTQTHTCFSPFGVPIVQKSFAPPRANFLFPFSSI